MTIFLSAHTDKSICAVQAKWMSLPGHGCPPSLAHLLLPAQQQAYRLKLVTYCSVFRIILLQNKNSPCPLLAATNAILLWGRAGLGPLCMWSGFTGSDNVLNTLADVSAANALLPVPSTLPLPLPLPLPPYDCDRCLDKALSLLLGLRRGVDVNPRFSSGRTGTKCTAGTAAFNLLGVELVNGWLLDPQDNRRCLSCCQGLTTRWLRVLSSWPWWTSRGG